MTFTRIGVIAARLIADPAKLQAAANEAPRKAGDEPDSREVEASDSSPIAQAGGTASNGEKSRPEPVVRANGATTSRGLKLVSDRGMRSVNRPKGFPSPALRRPVLLVVGGLHDTGP